MEKIVFQNIFDGEDNYDKYLPYGNAFATALDYFVTRRSEGTYYYEVFPWEHKTQRPKHYSCCIEDYQMNKAEFMSVIIDIVNTLTTTRHPLLEIDRYKDCLLKGAFSFSPPHTCTDLPLPLPEYFVYTIFWCCHVYCWQLSTIVGGAYKRAEGWFRKTLDEMEKNDELISHVDKFVLHRSGVGICFSEEVAMERETESQQQTAPPSPQKVEELMQSLKECMEKNRKLAAAVVERNKEIAELKSQLKTAVKAAERPVKETKGFTARQWGMFAYFNAEAQGIHISGNDQNIYQKPVEKCLAKMTGLSPASFNRLLVPKDDNEAFKIAATQVAEVIKDVFPETREQIYLFFDD